MTFEPISFNDNFTLFEVTRTVSRAGCQRWFPLSDFTLAVIGTLQGRFTQTLLSEDKALRSFPQSASD